MGGVEQYIADIVPELTKRGHKIFLGFVETTHRSPKEYSKLFLETFNLKSTKNQKQFSLPLLRQTIEKVKPDAIFVHKIDNAGNIPATFSLIPSVRMIHDHDLCCPRKHKYFWFNEKICNLPFGIQCFADLAFLEPDPKSRFKVSIKNLLPLYKELKKNRLFAHLMVGSEWMKRELLMNGFAADKVIVQPPVANLPKVDYLPPKKLNSILYVGQLVKGKGVDLLIKALANVKQDYYLKIVGEGNARNKLADLITNNNLEHKIELCGWVNRTQLVNYYRECLFTVVPSRWPEPFGMVGLEAMSFGRAIAGFDAGGISDWLIQNQNGLITKAGDYISLARIIDKMLKNHEKTIKMGLRGPELMSSKFSFSKSIDQLESTFYKLVSDHNKGQ